MEKRSKDAPAKIRALRKALDLNQEQFAAALEVSKTAVSAWERGLYEPSPETYIRLGNLANCSEVLWFWEKAKIDRKVLLSVAGQLLRENDASPTHGQIASIPQLDVQTEVSPGTAARILHIPVEAVLRLLSSGKLEARRAGKFHWVSFSSVMDYVNKHGRPA